MDWKKELVKFIKFNAVGLLNTLIDFIVYTILTGAGMYFALAQMISYGCGMLNSYLCNSRWTFQDKEDSALRVVAFVLVNLAALGVSIGILALCRSLWGLEGALAKLIATPFSLLINFIGNRLFVFRK